MALLVRNPAARIPLWLAHACEELRVFGEFTTVTARIETLPESKEGLLGKILDRLLKEDATGYLKKAVCLIAISRNGLPEKYMPRLLGESSEPASQFFCAEVRRHLKTFTRNSGDYMQRYVFSHAAIGKIVREKLCEDGDTARRYHALLAEFYERESSSESQPEYAFHLLHSGQREKLVNFLKSRRSPHIQQSQRQRTLQEVRCHVIARQDFARSQPAYLCIFCCGTITMMATLSHSCIVCGMCVPKGFGKPAYLCHVHRHIDWTGMLTCFHCNKVQPTTPPERAPKPAQLCQQCSVRDTCCKLCLV
ncbi:PREDICTED: uncharacterized protein LOC106817788 [Priapulus caudatus]|uniref:Uncharacterized protein LOC106817788 n=1 Tax=Priapulus caudatus TaxID=37621 RepID=A0ABM1F0K0_PRICU|nr:PREDICTED: uncharacterized protein LOC106817788 [Priapulus caudatus]